MGASVGGGVHDEGGETIVDGDDDGGRWIFDGAWTWVYSLGLGDPD